MRRALWETVAGLAEALRPRDGVGAVVRVTSVALDLPIEIGVRSRAGQVELLGDLPRWRWASGFEAHRGRLRLRLEQETAP